MERYSHIGVFDSGLGGLTVVRALIEQSPTLDITYFGDTARVPYGSKSPAVVRRYAFENVSFLLNQGVEAIVIACVTATACALEALQEWSPVPVYGAVEPGARHATEVTRGSIGVVGTNATIRSGIYPRTIESLRPGTSVCTVACPLFVPIVEEGFADHPAAKLIAAEYLKSMKSVDTLLLGCTHYPRLRSTLQLMMGPNVTLIDSAEAIAKRVSGTGSGRRTYYVSDDPERFCQLGEAFLGERFLAQLSQHEASTV